MEEFYKLLKSFLKELIQVFPDDQEIKIISTNINLSMIEKDNKIIVKFYKGLLPLEDLVLSKNDDFFKINPDDYWRTGSHELMLFTKLIYYWNEVSGNNKSVIWDYMYLIYQSSKRFNLN